MTNVAKNFATGSIGRSDLFSYRNDLLEPGEWTMEAVEKRPREAPDDFVETTSEKSTPCTGVKNDIDDAAKVGDLILTMPEIPWDSFEDKLARTNWEGHVPDCSFESTAFCFPSRDIFRTCCGAVCNLQSCVMLK